MTETVPAELRFQGLLFNYKKHLKYLVPTFFLILFVTLKLFMAKGKAETDYLSAKVAFEKWQEGKTFDNALLRNLRTLIRKYPELASKYDHAILQQMIAAGDGRLSEPLIEQELQKNDSLANYYDRFANSSLLIAKGEYEEAHEKAVALKEEMESNANFWDETSSKYRGSTLFAFNLLRIAMVCQKLERKEDELEAWNTFRIYAGWKSPEKDQVRAPVNRDAFAQLYNHFAHRKVSLEDYIRFREKSSG